MSLSRRQLIAGAAAVPVAAAAIAQSTASKPDLKGKSEAAMQDDEAFDQ